MSFVAGSRVLCQQFKLTFFRQQYKISKITLVVRFTLFNQHFSRLLVYNGILGFLRINLTYLTLKCLFVVVVIIIVKYI
jgi:hypothetical protein